MQRFVIFSAGYNCKDSIRNHMMSIQKQTYKNYIHIIVDDCSIDGTYEEIQKYTDDKTLVYRNVENKGCLYNALNYISVDSVNDVLVMVDLDDWLANNAVLKQLDNIYTNRNVWVTYGTLIRNTGEARENNFLGYTKQQLIQKDVKSYPWKFWALRTFKAFIWYNIKREDLLGPDGEYPPTSYDHGIGHPILEMTPHDKIYHVRNIVYVYNVHGLNDKYCNRENQLYYCSWYGRRRRYDILPYDYPEVAERKWGNGRN
jgi:glycosyltransferase involved in cell wall biosynthesis